MENTLLMKNPKANLLHMQVAAQCSPLLCGVKSSNILIIEKSETMSIIQLFRNTSILIKPLYIDDQKSFLLLFDLENVAKIFQDNYIKQFMRQKGYTSMDSIEILDEVAKRFTWFKEGKDDFPHELGIVLGYPIWDVIGFIQNKGKNSLLTGCWKVYQNLSQAKKTFLNYETAKEEVLKRLAEGESMKDIIEEYQNYSTKNNYYKEVVAIGY